MKVKDETEQDTAVNSPTRRSHDYLEANISNTKSHLLFSATEGSTNRMSSTEQEIYTHEVIREVMQNSKPPLIKASDDRSPMISTESKRKQPSMPSPSSHDPMSLSSTPSLPATRCSPPHVMPKVSLSSLSQANS
jgi:hypothetical protein